MELLYPSNIYCGCCGDAIDPDMPYNLCSGCVREIHWLLQALPGGGGEGEPSHLYRRAYSCAVYDGRTKAVIGKFKYKSRPGLHRGISQLMLERIDGEELSPHLVIPVPMNKRKERVRGYNQAELLAQDVAKGLNVSCACGLLVRTRDTEAMSTLSAEDRRLNLKNAFQIAEGTDGEGVPWSLVVRGKDILLVDDILTTGTTADECAGTLLGAGAASVDLLVFASGGVFPGMEGVDIR